MRSIEDKVKRRTPVQVRNFDTGVVTRYSSVTELADYEGIPPDKVIEKVQRGSNWLFKNRNQYRVDIGDEEWPSNPESRFILVYDTLTGEETRHRSQIKVGKLVGVKNVAIHTRLRLGMTGLINGRYAVKSENDLRSWEEMSKRKPSEVSRNEREIIDLNDESQGEYRYLDKYPGIRIYRNGKVVRESTSTVLGSVNREGYESVTIKGADGIEKGFRSHRLVAMAYLGCPENMDELHVNHIDFNRQNNAVENLEWVTPYENIKHSGYHNSESGIKFYPIQVRDFNSKEVREYHSIAEYARDSAMHKDTAQLRVSTGDTYLWPERLQYRLNKGDEPWCENPKGPFIKSLDVLTGQERLYKDAISFCYEHNVSEAAVSNRMTKKTAQPIKDRFLVKYEHDPEPWPTITDVVAYIAEHTQRTPIIAINPVTGEKKVFISAVECALEMGLKPSALNMRLKSGKPDKVYLDGFKYMYYSPSIQ